MTATDDDIALLLAEMSDDDLDQLYETFHTQPDHSRFPDVPSEREERIAWAEQGLLNFAYAYFPNYCTVASPPFHHELAQIALDVALCRGDYASKKGFVGAAPRGHGKCLAASTQVLCADGVHRSISEIEPGTSIVSLNQDSLKFERDRIIAKEHSGQKPTIQLVTRTGKSVIVSREHRVLTFDGWRCAGDIAVGDRLASPRDLIALDPSAELVPWENADVFWDQVTEVSDSGIQDTYDVQVEKNSNLVTNGLVTHNSALISLFLVVYCIVYRKKRFIVIFSDTDEPQAKLIAANVKAELAENELLRRDFGDLTGETHGMKWNEQDFYAVHVENGVVRHKTRVLSRGVGARARGLRDRDARPDLLVGDDIDNDDRVATPEQRDKIWNWFSRVMRPMLDPLSGRLLIVGTILHQDSLLSRLLDKAKAEASEYVGRIWRAIDEHGTVLWPELHPYAELMAIKATNPFAFATEYLNDPIDEESRVHRPEWLRWYTSDDIEYEPQAKLWTYKQQPLTIYGFVDPAISEKERADEFALVIAGITRDRRHLLILYVYHARIDFARQVDLCTSHARQWNVRRFGIERNAYQKALSDSVRDRLRAAKVRPVTRFVRKYDRIKGASPVYQQGVVLLRAATEREDGQLDELKAVRVHHSMWDFYRQLMYYPSSPHSDMIDAAEGVIHIAGGVAAFTGYAPVLTTRTAAPFTGHVA